jgi:DNA-binding LacI/PurR family transcriptional regulator
MNCPIVLLEDVKGIKANVVTVDLLGSVKKVVKYLIDNGHKKIIHFSGSLNAYRTIKRIEGFKLAFSESSLAFKKDMIVPIGISFHDGYYHTLRYFENLERENYPTAIVCSNDHQALAVIAALKQLNIQVPDDISIIGYEDIFHGESYPVPLTTIRTPQLEIGMTAARILIDNIESSTTKEDERIEISSEFIVGRTSKILN